MFNCDQGLEHNLCTCYIFLATPLYFAFMIYFCSMHLHIFPFWYCISSTHLHISPSWYCIFFNSPSYFSFLIISNSPPSMSFISLMMMNFAKSKKCLWSCLWWWWWWWWCWWWWCSVVDDDKQQLDEEVANVGDGVPMPELCSPVFPGNRTETIGFVYFFLILMHEDEKEDDVVVFPKWSNHWLCLFIWGAEGRSWVITTRSPTIFDTWSSNLRESWDQINSPASIMNIMNI